MPRTLRSEIPAFGLPPAQVDEEDERWAQHHFDLARGIARTLRLGVLSFSGDRGSDGELNDRETLVAACTQAYRLDLLVVAGMVWPTRAQLDAFAARSRRDAVCYPFVGSFKASAGPGACYAVRPPQRGGGDLAVFPNCQVAAGEEEGDRQARGGESGVVLRMAGWRISVRPFGGTDQAGDVMPGHATPHGRATGLVIDLSHVDVEAVANGSRGAVRHLGAGAYLRSGELIPSAAAAHSVINEGVPSYEAALVQEWVVAFEGYRTSP